MNARPNTKKDIARARIHDVDRRATTVRRNKHIMLQSWCAGT